MRIDCSLYLFVWQWWVLFYEEGYSVAHLFEVIMPRLGHMLMAFHEGLNHPGNLVQPRQNDLVTVNKALVIVPDSRLLTEVQNETLCFAQVVSRQPGEQVVDGLELKSSVEEIQPLGAVDIQGGAELALGKGLGRAQVRGRHSPVGEGDLDMQQDRDGVRYKDESHACRPVWQSARDELVSEKVPVARHEDDLKPSRPPRRAKLSGTGGKQMEPREDVEVEAGDSHDRIVGVLLVGDENVCSLVPYECEVIEGAVDGLEVGWRIGE